MKKTIALLMTLALLISAVTIPALAEETAGAVDQVTSATQNSQTGRTAKGGRGGSRQMPGQNSRTPGNGQLPQMPGQNGQNSQTPGNGQLPQMPGQNSQSGQMPGAGNGSRNKGAAGPNGQAVKGGKQLIFDRLLAEGVITQEVYDAITAWMNANTQPQADAAAPAEGSEPPALPEGTEPAEGTEPPAQPDSAPAGMETQLLKNLLDDGVITQEQYDLYLSRIQAAPAEPAAN